MNSLLIMILLPLLLSVLNIYNYSVPIGEEGNDTIMMYYDEPITEERWQEMEEADEKEHAKEAKEWYDEDD